MLARTLIARTGQVWKLWLSMLLTYGGSALLFMALWEFSEPSSVYLIGIGVVLCLLGLVIPSLAIRCPSCGARWYWNAISRRDHKRWFEGLSMSRCPQCGYYGQSAL